MTALTPERRERLWRKATCETRYLIGDHTAALVKQSDLCGLLEAADEADRLWVALCELATAILEEGDCDLDHPCDCVPCTLARAALAGGES